MDRLRTVSETVTSFHALADQSSSLSAPLLLNDTPEINESGIPAYLTSIISSSLRWITDEECKAQIWESASARLSERAGRTAMAEMSRRFRIPLDLGKDSENVEAETEFEIVLKEPSLTADKLGHKTWLASYLLARRLSEVLKSYGGFTSNSFQEGMEAPMLLELGSGTGLLGIAAAAVCPGVKVLLTDLPDIVGNLKENVEANAGLFRNRTVPSVKVLDWSMVPDRTNADNRDRRAEYDIIVAADSLYSQEHPRWLVNTIASNLKECEDALVIVELPLRDSYIPEVEDFRQRMLDVGLRMMAHGTEEGYEDWASALGERVTVQCWWAVWKWKALRTPSN